MAVHASAIGDGLNQSTVGWFDVSLDWTRMTWIRYDNDGSGGAGYFTNLYLWDTDGSASYGYVEAGLPGSPFIIDVETFSPGFQFAQYNAPIGTWFHFAMRYTAATHEVAVFLDGVRAVGYQPDVVADFSSSTTTTAGALTDSVSEPGNAAGYDRLFQAALSDVEILAEKNSPVAVRSANLLWDTPLPSPSDLNDISGNGHNWSIIGSLDYIQGPFSQAVLLTQLPLEAAYDMAAWRPYVGGGANGWETPAPPETIGDLP